MISPQLTVQCHHKESAPCDMDRGSDHQFSYFTPGGSNSVYSYQWSTEKWEELPPCPNEDSGLVIINGQLTAVGGEDGSRNTNKLFTLRQSQWIEEYPPMNASRSSTTVVSSSDGQYVIVIGGCGGSGGGWTATVELFQVSSRRWHKLKDLPHVQPLPIPSATICDNQLHVQPLPIPSATICDNQLHVQPLPIPSATICDNQLHVIGSDGRHLSLIYQ